MADKEEPKKEEPKKEEKKKVEEQPKPSAADDKISQAN